jgi:alpha-ketoglutarate-dependent 2,4-dichlorophenoxyacetate dioxygenase
MQVERIGNSFAGRVTGLDIAAGARPVDLVQVEQFLAEYPVLCFPDQPLTDEQQTAFVHALGPGFEAPSPYGDGDNVLRVVDVANVEPDGKPIAKGSIKAKFQDANLLWHTDGSYSQRPIRITGLSARTLPKHPPDTLYADMRAAWDALADPMKRRCENLIVEHSMYYSRRKMGIAESDFPDEFRKTFGIARHPLVRTHPISGRKSLYLASHVGGIVGWPEADASTFLDELVEFATRPEFVYAHKWRPRDFMMWDDSCTMHRATPYDGAEPRLLRWASVLEPVALYVHESEGAGHG